MASKPKLASIRDVWLWASTVKTWRASSGNQDDFEKTGDEKEPRPIA